MFTTQQVVWLNADVLPGPGADGDGAPPLKFSATDFCAVCQEAGPPSSMWRWPACGTIPHLFHAACVLGVQRARAGLGHWIRHSEISPAFAGTSCPLCASSGAGGPRCLLQRSVLAGVLAEWSLRGGKPRLRGGKPRLQDWDS